MRWKMRFGKPERSTFMRCRDRPASRPWRNLLRRPAVDRVPREPCPSSLPLDHSGVISCRLRLRRRALLDERLRVVAARLRAVGIRVSFSCSSFHPSLRQFPDLCSAGSAATRSPGARLRPGGARHGAARAFVLARRIVAGRAEKDLPRHYGVKVLVCCRLRLLAAIAISCWRTESATACRAWSVAWYEAGRARDDTRASSAGRPRRILVLLR